MTFCPCGFRPTVQDLLLEIRLLFDGVNRDHYFQRMTSEAWLDLAGQAGFLVAQCPVYLHCTFFLAKPDERWATIIPANKNNRHLAIKRL